MDKVTDILNSLRLGPRTTGFTESDFGACLYHDDEGVVRDVSFINEECVPASALAHIAKFPAAHSVVIQGVRAIEESGFAYLVPLANIKRVIVEDAPITDFGLSILSKMTYLECLWLTNTDVTDAGIPSLQNLPALKVLSLRETHVTDQGLIHIASIQDLRGLVTQHTRVTAIGLRRLQEALPNLAIRSGGEYLRDQPPLQRTRFITGDESAKDSR